MVNAFSFCLYGPYNPRYYPGMLDNIGLAKKHFPDWRVYVYVAPDVDASFVEKLRACPNVVIRETGETGAINMIHRFYAIDEPGVDIMMVRDADSRIHWKDRWAINDFLSKPQFVAHTIRDNIEHTARMMGGLWGIRKSAGINIHEEYENYRHEKTDHGMGYDQNFLTNRIYPKVASRILIHKCKQVGHYVGENPVVFPFEWTNDIYCGRIETSFVDRPQPGTPNYFTIRSVNLPFLPKGTMKLSRE